jgi:hypothetical protein
MARDGEKPFGKAVVTSITDGFCGYVRKEPRIDV